MELIVNQIKISECGKKAEFEYSCSPDIEKFFSKNAFYVEYDINISEIPYEILIIPFLANVMPIAWFAGFNVIVEKVDRTYNNSLSEIHLELSKYYSALNSSLNYLKPKVVIECQRNDKKQKTAMLFSGGVDAYTTYLRHYDEELELITIKGADVKIEDDRQWGDVLAYNDNTNIIKNSIKHYITSNIRDFITFEVDKLLPDLGWWGKIQHGLALTSLTAPLAYFENYKLIYIASSYTRREDYKFILWGSMPEIDNKVKWCSSTVVHDSAELTRQEKINLIIDTSNDIKIKPKLRVCYNEYKNSLNCSTCEKCLRTIFAIMIKNDDPNDYGFNVSFGIFDLLNKVINNGFYSEGNKLFWFEIYTEASKPNKKFFDENPEWRNSYDLFINNLGLRLSEDLKKTNKFKKIKLNIINKYPKLFSTYLKFRRKLI